MPSMFYSLVRRHMKLTSPGAFAQETSPDQLPFKLEFSPTESLVGWYRNPSPWEDESVVFTTEAIYLHKPSIVRRIAADRILDYIPPVSKNDVEGVEIVTDEGPLFVRVAGSFGVGGNQKDAFSFIMMIRGWLTVNKPDWMAPQGSSRDSSNEE